MVMEENADDTAAEADDINRRSMTMMIFLKVEERRGDVEEFSAGNADDIVGVPMYLYYRQLSLINHDLNQKKILRAKA